MKWIHFLRVEYWVKGTHWVWDVPECSAPQLEAFSKSSVVKTYFQSLSSKGAQRVRALTMGMKLKPFKEPRGASVSWWIVLGSNTWWHKEQTLQMPNLMSPWSCIVLDFRIVRNLLFVNHSKSVVITGQRDYDEVCCHKEAWAASQTLVVQGSSGLCDPVTRWEIQKHIRKRKCGL